MIESLSGGEKIRMMPQVPFANAGRCVTSRLQHLGQRDLIGVQPGGISREKHSRNMDPSGITTGEQCGPRGRAHRIPRIKIGEPHALLGQLIQVRCLDVGRSIATEILIPLIIGHDENDIWNRPCQRAKGHRGKPTDGNGAALEPRAAGCSILLTMDVHRLFRLISIWPLHDPDRNPRPWPFPAPWKASYPPHWPQQ